MVLALFVLALLTLSPILELIIIETEEFTTMRHEHYFGDKLSNECTLFLLWEL